MIVDGTVSSSIFVIRHLPSPFRFSPSARLTVTFDHVSKPCRFNKGTDVGDDVIPDVHGSPLERAYLHFPPVFPLRRGKRGRFRARNQATKRSFLGNNGRINAFRAPGTRQDFWTYSWRDFTKLRLDTARCTNWEMAARDTLRLRKHSAITTVFGTFGWCQLGKKEGIYMLCIIIILSLNDNQRQYISPYIFL